jgi:hypothetical protein
MMDRKMLLKCSMAVALAAGALQPTLAGAAACAGPKKNWTVLSDTFGNLQCGILSSRGTSKGGTSLLPGGQAINTSLTVRLIQGIHASGIAYNAVGVMSNCAPFDNSTVDGSKTVGAPGCLGGVQHQVVVVF